MGGGGSIPGLFLSCLGGSELDARIWPTMPSFLSCLGGSELDNMRQEVWLNFLSCLGGSELR